MHIIKKKYLCTNKGVPERNPRAAFGLFFRLVLESQFRHFELFHEIVIHATLEIAAGELTAVGCVVAGN